MTPQRMRYAMYLKSGGRLLADKIIHGLCLSLRANGATMLAHREAVKLVSNMTEVVLNDGSSIKADGVLVAPGAWVGRLLPEYSGEVHSHCSVVVFLEAPATLRSAWRNSPILVDMGARGNDLWGAPAAAGTRIKLGCDALSTPGAASDDDTVNDAEICQHLIVWDDQLPRLSSYQVIDATSAYFTSGHSQNFLARPLARNHHRSWVLTRCAGHGYKFGPALAEKLAVVLDRGQGAGAFMRWAGGLTERTALARDREGLAAAAG